MLNKNDFLEKQVLVIQGEKDLENKVRFQNENVVFFQEGKRKKTISTHKLFSIFFIGNLSVTNKLIENSLQRGISIHFLNYSLKQYASINSQAEGNCLLRENQYKLENDLEISKKIMKNKMINQLKILKGFKKIDSKEYKTIKKKYLLGVEKSKSKKELLGVEGNLSKFYFKTLFYEFDWYRRMPRTKIDPINLLMDIGYTFVFNFVDSLLALHGFDRHKGIYHELFFQRKSLSCDIMEPFRCIVDRSIVKSFHLGKFDLKDFNKSRGKYYLKYEISKKYTGFFLEEILNNKMDFFSYVRNFYKFMMDNQNDFPEFKIR